MKIPTARRLPSGSWTIRVRVDKKDISITRDTEKECIAAAAAVKAGTKQMQKENHRTLASAIDNYISMREELLSPSTIRGYRQIRNNRFQSAMGWDISKATEDDWQDIVNLESKSVSAKTLQNSWRFVSSVIYKETGNRFNIRLKQVVSEERPWLTPDQIKEFLKVIEGTNIEIPALMALCSLRRSEIMSVRWNDIDLENSVMTVHGSAVYNDKNELVQKKENKNKKSRRTVPIIPPLKAALESAEHKGEYVVNWNPSALSTRIRKTCEENGLPPVSLHGLRHSFASLAYHLQIPEAIAMQIGGWSDNQTMRKIYTHIAEKDIAEQSKAISDFFK